MNQEYEKSIKPILDVYDKVREVLRNEELDLPKIVVVGDQSSGKSSVLESITKISLPRGENTVTKCPIVIQLRSSENEEYATIREEGQENEIKIPLKDLSEKIAEAQTNLIKKVKQEITDIPLYVNVKMQGAPDLTIYDLPGITYKDEDLTKNIKKIIEKYTAGKSTLILLVIPGNSDFTTSEAISLVRKNQDYKERTLAIITKIDLGIQQDRKIHEKIKNNELNLIFDPIIVRNRTQEELEKNIDIDIVKKMEMDLINGHAELKKLNAHSKGTNQLIGRLVFMQKQKLLSSKLDIKEKILEKIKILKKQFKKLPLPAETFGQKIERFRECINALYEDFNSKADGFCSDESQKELNIPSRLKEIFEKHYLEFSKIKNIFFTKEFYDKIKFIVKESNGLNLPNFMDPKVFNSIISKQIKNIHEGNFTLLKTCGDFLKNIMKCLITGPFKSYPSLSAAIVSELNQSLDSQIVKIEEIITELFESEMQFPYTIDPYYIDVLEKLGLEIKNKKNLEKKYEHERILKINDLRVDSSSLFQDYILKSNEIHVVDIQLSCFAYFSIFESRFVDYFHKLIISKLVHFYRKNLCLIIEKKFAPRDDLENEWISEERSITKERNEILISLESLEVALMELNKIS